MVQHKWLQWAMKIQAISQIGLTYSKDVYDRERYEELRNLSVEIMAEYTNTDHETVARLFANETGYATPKVDIRAVVFRDGKLLLVREKNDGGWSLPGGWADIGLSPTQIAVKEVKEESGFDVVPIRLLAVIDRNRHDHPPLAYEVYKMFILCDLVGGEAAAGVETSGVGFFAENELPELSLDRNLPWQLKMMFEYLRNPQKEVYID